ncbi:hypothetical protein LP419_09160 [Massilia sp. H-1]|nr:hypothetical protein LP419_09160 [Massilia sp. H-1]
MEIFAQGPMMTASLISPSGSVLHHRARRRTTPHGRSRGQGSAFRGQAAA